MKILQLNQSHVRYALLMCGVTAGCLLLMEATGQNQSFDHNSPIFVFAQFIAPAIVWYLGLKSFKKAHKNKMTFKQGLGEGFKISVAYGLLSPFVFLAYYTLINPSILEYVKNAYSMKEAEDAVVITVDMIVQFFAAIAFGTLYGAIISFFLKSKK